jgi:phosphoribosyl 1,2-cyclic phosphodiesterase
MKVKFWGTRGSIASPGKDTCLYGGNTTCLECTLASGKRVVIDAGTGIRLLGDHLAATEEKPELHLLITHIHWDHVLGFPFFAPIYNRECRIWVDGFPTCIRGLKFTFDNHMGDGFFPVSFNDLKADIRHLDILRRKPLEIDGAVIHPFPLQHPQGGYGFRFRENNKTLVFLSDNELRGGSWGGRHLKNLLSFCRDADILIHDAQYLPEEMEARRGWGHSDYVKACELAAEAHVKKLILFHHDPSRKDVEVSRMVKECRRFLKEKGVVIEVEAAQEGVEVFP